MKPIKNFIILLSLPFVISCMKSKLVDPPNNIVWENQRQQSYCYTIKEKEVTYPYIFTEYRQTFFDDIDYSIWDIEIKDTSIVLQNYAEGILASDLQIDIPSDFLCIYKVFNKHLYYFTYSNDKTLNIIKRNIINQNETCIYSIKDVEVSGLSTFYERIYFSNFELVDISENYIYMYSKFYDIKRQTFYSYPEYLNYGARILNQDIIIFLSNKKLEDEICIFDLKSQKTIRTGIQRIINTTYSTSGRGLFYISKNRLYYSKHKRTINILYELSKFLYPCSGGPEALQWICYDLDTGESFPIKSPYLCSYIYGILEDE